MAKIGTRQTERFDDLAAEEINELEGVLVLDRQAHEELGESAFSFIRSAEFAKCAAFFAKWAKITRKIAHTRDDFPVNSTPAARLFFG